MKSPTRGIVFCAHISPLLDSEGLQDKECPAFPYILLIALHTVYFFLISIPLIHAASVNQWMTVCSTLYPLTAPLRSQKQTKMIMSSLEVKQENKVQKVHQTQGVSKKAGAVQPSPEGVETPS